MEELAECQEAAGECESKAVEDQKLESHGNAPRDGTPSL